PDIYTLSLHDALPISKPAPKTVADNRRARHEYEIIDTVETGIELAGTEVKSMRNGKANLQDAYARIEDGELWLYNCHISPYEFGDRKSTRLNSSHVAI